ncbi:MAG: uroporphyrinogen-III synthase [Pseudomonadota bacterium]|nr:uroporphyrinogen-III synthase [Pseudomonadota bacterium]
MKQAKYKRILVTQSNPNQNHLLTLLQRHGYTTYSLPCTQVTPKKISSFTQKTAQEADTWIFLSANAVRCCHQHLRNHYDDQTIIAIGPATARTLEELGTPVDYLPEDNFNSESIAKLNYFSTHTNRKISIFSGNQSTSNLNSTLNRLGHTCKKIITHSTQIIEITKAMTLIEQIPTDIDAITSHSLMNLKHLCSTAQQLKQPWIFHCPLLVVSKKMADCALEYGFKSPILESPDASAESITSTLQNWINHKETYA